MFGPHQIHIEISTIDELTGIEVDAVNAKVDKIVELTLHDDVGAVGANLVAEEVTCNLANEVLDTSIEDSWS